MILRRFLVVLALVALACSCREAETIIPIDSVATVTGSIKLYTEFGALVSDRSGATVTFAAGDNMYSAVTDEEGSYSIGVPTGTYTVTIEKPLYVTRTFRGKSVVGGMDPVYFSEWTIGECTSRVNNLVLTRINSYTFRVKGNIISEKPALTNCVIFFNTSPEVGPNNAIYIYSPITGAGIDAPFTPNLEKGTTIYAVAYAVSGPGYSQLDLITKKTEYLGLSKEPSNVASIVIE